MLEEVTVPPEHGNPSVWVAHVMTVALAMAGVLANELARTPLRFAAVLPEVPLLADLGQQVAGVEGRPRDAQRSEGGV